jgi:hypothetical protein
MICPADKPNAGRTPNSFNRSLPSLLFITCCLPHLFVTMAALSKLSALVSAGASLAAILTQPAVRAFLVKWSGFNAPGGGWRILAILFLLGNWKNLPFVWHVRVLSTPPPPPNPSPMHPIAAGILTLSNRFGSSGL